MDGLNRYRFADNPDSLAGWESASNVVGPPRAALSLHPTRHRKAARSSPRHDGARPFQRHLVRD